MTEDLVRRLREGDHFEKVMSAEQAADRIEELETKLAEAEARSEVLETLIMDAIRQLNEEEEDQ